MAFEGGKEVLLQVADPANPSPTELVAVKGQQSTSFDPETITDDITDKTNVGWQSFLNVLKSGVVNCSGKANWPDTTGLERVRAAWDGQLDIEAKIILNSAGANYLGFWQVTQFQISGEHTGATAYTIQLRNNGALVYAAS